MARILPKEIFDYFAYDPETGGLRWKRDNGRKCPKGKKIGCKNERGYIRAGFKGKLYYGHRIAWAIGHNTLDVPVILDHINGDPSDNRLCNLRAATNQQNSFNSRPKRNGLKGAYFRKKENKWNSKIQINGKTKHLGYFDTEIEAHEAYCRAAQKLQGEFSNPG